MPYRTKAKNLVNLSVDESPIRTAYPVNTNPPNRPPPVSHTGHAGGSSHDPTCATDLRRSLDYLIKF